MARRRLKSRHEGLELPGEIIQHIQSFMERIPAARTSLLSKSWYKAWSTRPNLYFYSGDFRNQISSNWDFVTKTVERYLAQNLKVEKFTLDIGFTCSVAFPLVDNLFADALKLRVNVFEFVYCGSYVLPEQVFAHKYLTKLHLANCQVDHLISGNVLCSNLRSLTLDCVYIDDRTFKDILAQCPNIEYLRLHSLKTALTGIDASNLLNLKTLIVLYGSLGLSGITSSFISGRFLNVSHLDLSYMSVGYSFFTKLSSCFPKLEDLKLDDLNNNTCLRIASPSLKRLSLKDRGMLKRAYFDVPNIRNFKLNCVGVPRLSFRPTSAKEWKSQLTFSKCSNIRNWLKLRDNLVKLGQSKITLTLRLSGDHSNVAIVRNIEMSCLPVVEHLEYSVIRFCREYNMFIEYLSSCRPKLVSLQFASAHSPDTITIPFMYKKLMKLMNQNNRNDLKEVDVQFFEDSLKQWQTIKILSNDLEILNLGADRLLFKLTWGSFTPKHTIIKLIQCC